jgi:hypothetical protein
MRARSFLVLATVSVLAAGLTIDVAGCNTVAENQTAQATLASQVEGATYYEPRVEGFSLDSRLMSHMRESPVLTAERYCRNNGFSTVADLTLRASTATRTIEDGALHQQAGRTYQAFAMIRCQTHQESPVSKG